MTSLIWLVRILSRSSWFLLIKIADVEIHSYYDPIVDTYSPSLNSIWDRMISLLLEEADSFLGLADDRIDCSPSESNFLEGVNKLPVIIAKELDVEENIRSSFKGAKFHKRVSRLGNFLTARLQRCMLAIFHDYGFESRLEVLWTTLGLWNSFTNCLSPFRPHASKTYGSSNLDRLLTGTLPFGAYVRDASDFANRMTVLEARHGNTFGYPLSASEIDSMGFSSQEFDFKVIGLLKEREPRHSLKICPDGNPYENVCPDCEDSQVSVFIKSFTSLLHLESDILNL
ncbi:hypothetical protein Tco_1291545 [Tanacetum coccineum]